MKKRLLVSALLALGLAGADPVVDPVDDGAGPGAPDRELASDDMIEGTLLGEQCIRADTAIWGFGI